MVTKREYLIEKGLAKAGPGRPSRAAKEAIETAINAGMKFDDPKSKSVIVISKDENGNEIQTTKRIADIPEVPDPRTDRPKGYYTFRNPDGSTFQRLHTEACAKCHYSFRWCYCVEGPTQFPSLHLRRYDVYATLDRVPDQAAAVITPRKGRRKVK